MKRWLEIVRLRSASNHDFCAIEKDVRAETPDGEPHMAGITVFHHGEIENDLAIHILWGPPGCTKRGSTMGNRIAFKLREFGMVDHSVWIGGDDDD
jgi:hypothetical protein